MRSGPLILGCFVYSAGEMACRRGAGRDGVIYIPDNDKVKPLSSPDALRQR